MRAKDLHKKKMLEYWSDPGNDFLNRQDMAKYLGIVPKTLYQHFTPAELTVIETQAETARRGRYNRERSEIITTLYKKGKAGDIPAAREFLDRTEGKVTDKVESKVNAKMVITWQES